MPTNSTFPLAMESTRQLPCDLCGETEFHVLSDLDRHRRPLRTVVCTTCGLVSHERIPTEKELEHYYALEYRREYHNEFSPAAHRVMRAWRGGQWLLRLLSAQLPADGQICEIGSGIGCTVKVLEQAGYNAVGVEPGFGFQQFSRDVLRARVERVSLFDMPAQEKFDFLLLLHVIEHFRSPRAAMQHMRHLLRPGGRLYVECPNWAAPHAAPGKQFHFAHVHNFSPRTLRQLGEACGFRLHATLARPSERVLRYIFERTEDAVAPDYRGGYEATMDSLKRQNRWSYYLRPNYLAERLVRDVNFAGDRWRASRRLQSLLSSLHKPSSRTRPGEAIERAA